MFFENPRHFFKTCSKVLNSNLDYISDDEYKEHIWRLIEFIERCFKEDMEDKYSYSICSKFYFALKNKVEEACLNGDFSAVDINFDEIYDVARKELIDCSVFNKYYNKKESKNEK